MSHRPIAPGHADQAGRRRQRGGHEHADGRPRDEAVAVRLDQVQRHRRARDQGQQEGDRGDLAVGDHGGRRDLLPEEQAQAARLDDRQAQARQRTSAGSRPSRPGSPPHRGEAAFMAGPAKGAISIAAVSR